uniref:Complement factor properdin n=1 Tax=Podarcis muralis TaxID=64176 RepID=A0A670KHQ2_PODMU|nr:properdin isoform X1 [Podarcis muralis]
MAGGKEFWLLVVVSWWFGVLKAPAGAQNVFCYGAFDVTSGKCNDLLGEGVAQDDCCLNHQYSFQLDRNGPCQACQAAHWSDWSPWSPCSVSCREGVQRRNRTCRGRNGPAGFCQASTRQWEMQACSLMACCPRVGGWSAWAAWSPCSVTCLRGLQTRKRTCTNPAPDCGGSCLGDGAEQRSCDTNLICPTHGNWGNWGNWEPCPATCIPEGSGPQPRQQRRRHCNSPPPSRDPPGNPCPGADQDYRSCSGLPFCPQDGSWGSWKPTGSCSVTCGVGRTVEKRLCDSPAPKHGGKFCPGPDTHTDTCNTRTPCPVDGRWREWSEWSVCENKASNIRIACDELTGLQRRTRTCVGRAHEGKRCVGPTMDIRSCYNVQLCSLKGAWTEWSPWGLCNPPCGEKPMKSRKRECKAIYPNYPMTVEGENGKVLNVSFWGHPRPNCQPLDGQGLVVEEQAPCQNVPPCED